MEKIKKEQKGLTILFDKITVMHLTWLFIPIFAASMVLRQIQLLYAVEADTGFYSQGHFSVPTLTYLLIAAAVIYVFTGMFYSKSEPMYIEHFMHSSPVFASTGYASVILLSAVGVSFLLYGVLDVYHALTEDIIPIDLLITGSLSALASLHFFFMLSYRKDNASALHGFLSLIPVLWGAVGLILAFISHTSIANISGLLFEVLTMIACTLYLLYQSKAVIGMTAIKPLLCFGYLYLLFTGLSIISSLINRIVSDSGSQSFEPGGLRNIFLALYVGYAIINIIKYEKSSKVVVL